MITLFGYIDLFMSYIDSDCALRACQATYNLIKKEEGAQDAFYRRGGVAMMVNCLQSENMDLKLVALQILI